MLLHHAQLRLLTTLLSALNKSNGLKCLGHVFFTPGQGQTIITATDLDLHIYWPVPLLGARHSNAAPASGKPPSTTANNSQPLQTPTSCPIPWFLKIANSVKPGGHLELRHDHHHLCAYPSTGPSARSPESAISFKECPEFTTQHFTHGGWLSHPTLEKAVSAIPFISTDKTRHVLQGIHITQDGHLVATDGRKLAHAPTPGTQLPRDIILPTRMIRAFETLSNGTVDGTDTTYGPEHLRMQCWLNHPDRCAPELLALHSGCYLKGRLIDGNFPNWRMVLPTTFSTLIDIAPEFLAILKVTLPRSPDKKTTQVTFDLQPNGTVLAAIHCTTGSQRTDLIDPCEAGRHTISPDQPLFKSCWNAPFLLACLQFSGLRLRTTNDISPFLSGDPTAAQTVLMPMRAN